MQVSQESARKLLKGLGYATADEWPSNKLAKRLGAIKDNQTQIEELEDTEDKNLCDALLEAIENGEEIEINSDETEAPVKGSKAKGDKSKKASATAGKKSSDGKKDKVGLDRFGCRVGSVAAQINEQLGRKPKSAKEVAESSGSKLTRVHSHLRWLCLKGHVERTDKGFAVKSSK